MASLADLASGSSWVGCTTSLTGGCLRVVTGLLVDY